MAKSESKLSYVPGCEISFYSNELHVLKRFFNCRSGNDLARAAKRFQELLLSRAEESHCALELSLVLASELYTDFSDLEKCPIYKFKRKKNGPSPKTRNLPKNILKVMSEEKKRKDWDKNPTELDVIRRLQRKNILPANLKVSTLKKDIEQLRREQKEADAVERFVTAIGYPLATNESKKSENA